MRRLGGVAIALMLSAPALMTAAVARADAPGSFTVPDYGRFMGSWLWIKTDGAVGVSDPGTKGAARTLVFKPDLTYEFHQRRDTRDSVLCRGTFLFSEESGGGYSQEFLQLEGWFERYERRMTAEFDGPDTLILAGDPCVNCPEHTFVRGRTASFQGSVKKGERFRRDLWDGLRLELDPTDQGWDITVRDTTRASEDLASLTPPFHFVPNPTDIEGWHFRNKANTGPNQGDVNAPGRVRDFIFSREVGYRIQPAGAEGEITEEEVERVGNAGRGVLTIDDMVLTAPRPGERAGIESMRFTVAIEEVRGRGTVKRP
ncbi:MAG TPA: hypothetical protein VK527_00165 [Candidatus Limnocylindrales bacterium]|nr:hypothetical protein [Candidatus Limnocylindrales bacterium]